MWTFHEICSFSLPQPQLHLASYLTESARLITPELQTSIFSRADGNIWSHIWTSGAGTAWISTEHCGIFYHDRTGGTAPPGHGQRASPQANWIPWNEEPPKKKSSIPRVKLTTCSHLMTRRSDFLISAVEPGCKDSKSHPWKSGLKFSTLLGCAWYIGMKYMKAGGNPTQSPWIKVKEPQQNHKLVGEQMLDRPSPKQIRKRIGENAPKKDWNNQPVSACFLSMLASHCCEASAWTSSEVARAEKLPLLSWVKVKSLAHKNEEINWLTLKYFWN